MKVRNSLENARLTLLNQGWCQGTFVNGKGEHCVIGAFGWDPDEDTMEVACNLLREVVMEMPLIPWNDAPERRKEHLLETFNIAIGLANSRGL